MVWKQATDCCAGTAAIFGAPDLLKVSQLFSDTDITDTVTIHETVAWTFQSNACTGDSILISNPAQTFTYNIRASAIGAQRDLILPLLLGDDTIVTECHIAILVGKTLTTPTISATGFTNAQHAHLGATSGGTITEASISDLQCYILDVTGSGLLDARFWIGDGANLAVELTISGGVTVANTGVATVVTNANLTGPVTSAGNATTITGKAITIAMLADGTDGELITWNACAVAATVGVGNCGEFLKSQGAGCPPIFATLPCGATPTESMMFAASDETTALTTGLKLTFHMPYAFTLTDIKGSLTTASCCGVVTVDVSEAGTSIMTCCKVQFDACEATTETAACPPVLTDTSLANNAVMTICVDVAGMCAAGLKITLIGTQT